MPSFNVSVPHRLQRDILVARLQGFSEEVRASSPVELTNVQENWDDTGNLKFSFSAMGLDISGSLLTSDSEVTVSGKLPFAAMPFRGAIESQIKAKIEDAISADDPGSNPN